jgi:hypothetical protein
MRSELVYRILLENSPDAVYFLSGTINMESKVGTGTTTTILIPK